eukprot:1156248-Pelagomonas_calceolata.AAC.3
MWPVKALLQAQALPTHLDPTAAGRCAAVLQSSVQPSCATTYSGIGMKRYMPHFAALYSVA